MKTKDRKYTLPGHIIEESKLLEQSNKYIKKLAKKHTKNSGIDILEFLSFLSLQKSPIVIINEGGYVTDEKNLGSLFIAGSKEVVDQKINIDNSARKIIELLQKYKLWESFADKKELDKLFTEIYQVLNEYYDISTNLYFLYNEKENAIKIGRSKNIKKRKSALQTGSVNELKILYSCPARKGWEDVFKNEFSEYKIRGEFYKADEEIFKFILWLKYIQENDLDPRWITRSKYNNKLEYKNGLEKLLKESKYVEGFNQ